MSKVKDKELKSTLAKPIAESGSPYDYYGCGPRIRRLTTWELERWERVRDPLAAGLPPLTREAIRFHTWEDLGIISLSQAYYAARVMTITPTTSGLSLYAGAICLFLMTWVLSRLRIGPVRSWTALLTGVISIGCRW
ncbi:hypothetical protein ES703_81798 [subsurface metagenome]